MNTKPIKANIITKPSLFETLRRLPVNVPSSIHHSQFKSNVVRSAISNLKKEGYRFECTEAGLQNEIVVTRLK